MSLRFPLSLGQVNFACELHAKLKQWEEADKALETLRDMFRGFGSPETLIKAAAINGLHRTNLYDLETPVKHIMKVMAKPDVASQRDHDLVERLAQIPSDPVAGARGNYLVSFASKFAHFFICADAFPLYDKYALAMVNHHLGLKAPRQGEKVRYLPFASNVDRLCKLAGLTVSYRQLDRYLWITGQYKVWEPLKDKKKAKINKAVSALFENEAKRLNTELGSIFK